ncbi:MAG: tetratricopeptide repeat protein [Candidatus Magnetominusculus sp. LBB02]|nr:tetratricopeptide repeat protein [Candidatus Magnetominusculus sp. LBB02]
MNKASIVGFMVLLLIYISAPLHAETGCLDIVKTDEHCAYREGDTISNSLGNDLVLRSTNGNEITVSPGAVFRAIKIDNDSEQYYQQGGNIYYKALNGFLKVYHFTYFAAARDATFSVGIDKAMDNITFSVEKGGIDVISEFYIKVGTEEKDGYRKVTSLSALGRRAKGYSLRRDEAYGEFDDYHEVLDYYAEQLNEAEKGGDIEVIRCVNNNVSNAFESISMTGMAVIGFKQILEGEGNDVGWQAVANSGIGLAWNIKGDYDKAIEYYERALEQFTKIYRDEPNPSAATVYNDLGIIWADKGRYDRAIENFEKARQMRLVTAKPRHDVADTYNNLGEAWRRKGQYDRAIEYSEVSLALREDIGLNTDTANAYGNLGIAWADKGQYDRAIRYYKKAIAILVKIDRASCDLAVTYNHLGSAWEDKGQYDRAIRYHNRALAMFLELYNTESHRDVAATYNSLGIAWAEKKKYDRAIDYFNKSLKIRLELYDNGRHLSVAAAYNNLGLTWASKRQYGRAIEYYEKAVNVLEELEITDNPDYEKYKKNLERAQKKLRRDH